MSTSDGDQRTLVHCFGGCPQQSVIDALQERGLWPQIEKSGVTLAELAAAKKLPLDFLQKLGWGDRRWRGTPAVVIPYLDSHGGELLRRHRIRLRGPDHYRSAKGVKLAPYGLNRLDEARQAGYAIILEGETDAATSWLHGFPCLGVPGANAWRAEWASHLNGFTVYIWREPDSGGKKLAQSITDNIADARIIEPPAGIKDVNELWMSCDDADDFRQQIRELMNAARPVSELRAETLSQEARDCWEKARYLLEDPNLLDRVGNAIHAGGYVGDLTPPLLASLALTSRLLDRPLNLAFVAPSAAGKNHGIDAALALTPETAYHLEKAGSARALIYNDADYQHRTVVVSEADSIPENGPAASAIRALAADNVMAYDVVEKDSETGRFTTRHVVKPGPTGLITTSTRPLPEQMATRMLAVGIADTPDQTRSVLIAHAESVNRIRTPVDTNAFVAVQRWLELKGERRVAVPYAVALAEAVPADHVRMRRDFRQLLTVIQAVAFLYQCQRKKDAQGRVIATLEDYRRARDLLLEVFTEVAAGGVSRTIRETVDALRRLCDRHPSITIKGLGDDLGLAKDTTWYRVKQAIGMGYIQNLETRKGHPAKLMPGDPLPEDRPALPTVDELNSAHLRIARSTVQPADEGSICPESEHAVASSVETPIQPRLQPHQELHPDSEAAPYHRAVERSNGNWEDTHLCDHRECKATGEYRDDTTGNWFCWKHGPTWTTPGPAAATL